MSRALDFLTRARPEAMSAYFTFLRSAGQHLDPRTRALISIITKVSSQTERGLLQYTRRALAAGVTPAEILDALLMAFPALGLSRIVWAVDVLLEHAVPGFDETLCGPVREVAAPARMALGACTDLPERRVVKRGSTGHPLLLYRDGATVRAFKAICPHQGTELDAPRGDTPRVKCAWHGWTFELPSGRCLHGGAQGLQELDVHLEDGQVHVTWQD